LSEHGDSIETQTIILYLCDMRKFGPCTKVNPSYKNFHVDICFKKYCHYTCWRYHTHS